MTINLNNLYHIARLALSGKDQDVRIYLQRLARRLEAEEPKMAKKIQKLIQDTPSPWREASPVPVDTDSHLNLVHVEPDVAADITPVLEPPVKQMIEQLILERQMLDVLLDKGVDPTNTALFVGPPGVGKTMTARWVATLLEKPLMTLDLSAVMSSFLGKTGLNVRNVLDYAKQQDCVLLLDEFDAIAKRRDDDTEIGELKRLVNVLLQEVDLWPETGLIIAATNHGALLDPAVWRRFDVIIEFPMPSPESVEKIIRLYWEDAKPKDEKVIKILSVVWRDKSPSDIARGVSRLRRHALVFGEEPIESARVLLALDLMVLDKRALKELASLLVKAGISLREAAKITGLARDTVKKAT